MYKKADPFKKVFGKGLTSEVKRKVLLEARNLLKDLEANFLLVTAEAAPRPQFTGHKIRIVHSRNPRWYREIYSDLDVKRDRIIDSLNRIVQGKPSNMSSYDYMFIHMIKDRLLNGYDVDGGLWVYHDNSARDFMGLAPIEVPKEIEPEYSDEEMF